MTLTFSGWLSHTIRLCVRMHISVRTPQVLLPAVWPLPLSLATTRGISVDFSSFGYLDVSVPRVPRLNLWIQLRLRDSSSRGFPHSDIRGSMLIYISPQLFAVSHVLLRLPVPRHSPYALVRLNSLSCCFSELLSFVYSNCFGLLSLCFADQKLFVFYHLAMAKL